MRRDLTNWAKAGEEFLEEKHPAYLLTHTEIINLFNSLGVSDSQASKCFDVMNAAFFVGVECGKRAALRELEGG